MSYNKRKKILKKLAPESVAQFFAENQAQPPLESKLFILDM